MDILIRGGTALTMDDARPLISPAVIGIKGDTIAFLEEGPLPPTANLPAADRVIDASGTVILPGLVNTHTHLPMSLFRGLADDLPLMDWLNNHIFPAEAAHIRPETVRAGTMLSLAEMILSGTTTFCDGYFYEGRVAEAALEVGLRGVVAQGFIDYPTPENPNPAENVRIAERFISRWRDASPLITPALFLHSPYTCSAETLRSLKDVAHHHGTIYCIHLAETRDETETIRERFGTTPVRYLQRLGVLDENTLAVHANWLDDEEIAILGDHGVRVSHCPESGMKLAAGVAPVPAFLKRGVTVGLGTDGCASNNDLDLFREMDTAAKLHKIRGMDPTVMDARTVLRMATLEGARCLNLSARTGSLAVGKAADLVLVDFVNKPHLAPLYNPWSQIVYAATGADVATVLINGRIVLKDRKLLTLDPAAVIADVETLAEKIRPPA